MKYLAALVCLVACSCGYRISGKTDLLPTTVKTIAIPAFGNLTDRYKLTDVIPQALAEEFVSRTRYKVVETSRADAVLTGSVLNFTFNPTVFDPTTGRASVAEVHLTLQVKLVDSSNGKVLFQRSRLVASSSYQICCVVGTSSAQYFDESDAALQRVSKELASQVVSSILENF
jgi:hypothetical protein